MKKKKWKKVYQLRFWISGVAPNISEALTKKRAKQIAKYLHEEAMAFSIANMKLIHKNLGNDDNVHPFEGEGRGWI